MDNSLFKMDSFFSEYLRRKKKIIPHDLLFFFAKFTSTQGTSFCRELNHAPNSAFQASNHRLWNGVRHFSKLLILPRYTKLGFAGNEEPQHIIPTILSYNDNVVNKAVKAGGRPSALEDIRFHIGNEAVESQSYTSICNPIKHGQVDNWDTMERYWEQCIFKYLRCEPEDHPFILTEPPMNAPENREYTAEIMFESFNVPSLYIGVQAVLALAASFLWDARKEQPARSALLNGTVVDSGDGVTHIIPVIEGYVVPSAIQHIPIGGREVTTFLQQILRERENIPQEETFEIAKYIKESKSFISQNLRKDWEEFIKTTTQSPTPTSNDGIIWKGKKTGQEYKIDLGFERFVAPEIFFDPQLISSEYRKSLAELVDESIQKCPIDTRRSLYKNICLSGGSTMFKGFGSRLQNDLQSLLKERMDKSENSPEVHVSSNKKQRYAVWYGASMLANIPKFSSYCTSKEQYNEHGPSIFRTSTAVPFF